jgi:hypothetical protein
VCGTRYEIEHTARMLCSGLCLVTWIVRAAWHNPLSSPTWGLCRRRWVTSRTTCVSVSPGVPCVSLISTPRV